MAIVSRIKSYALTILHLLDNSHWQLAANGSTRQNTTQTSRSNNNNGNNNYRPVERNMVNGNKML